MKKKQVYAILIICISSMMLWSCINVTKRKHRSGYHVEWDLVKLKKKGSTKNTQDDSMIYVSINKGLLDFSSEDNIEKSDSIFEFEFAEATDDNSIESVDELDSVDSVQNIFAQSETVYKNHRRWKDDVLPDKKGGFLFWSLGGITLLTLATRKKAKKLSKWAAENKSLAQVFVGVSATLLPIVSFLLGWLEGDGALSGLKLGLFSTLGLLSVGTYFHKRTNKGFFLRKFKEFFFIIAMVGLFNTAGNKLSEDFHKSEYSASFEKSVKNELVYNSLIKVDETSDKLLRFFGKLLLSILLLILLYFLEILLLVLSCSLLCSGYGIAALILSIGGSIGIIALLVFGLIKIWKKHKGKKDTLTDEENAENDRRRTTVLMTLLAFLIGLIVLASLSIS